MKSSHPCITLLGSNSGRNLGDAAILASILSSISNQMPDAEFFVPSSNPGFVENNYGGKYKVKGVGFMPWTFSVRMIGVPTFRAIARSDAALICDGIIFGRKLWNPFFNWLNNLIFVVPWAKLTRCKVILFSCGIGPFPSRLSRMFARFVMNRADLVILRDHDSESLARQIGVTRPIEVTGDAAFINEVSPDSAARQIMKEEGIDETVPILGVNVNSYFDAWLPKSERTRSRKAFLEMLADGIALARRECGFQCVCFSTHPMDEDAVHSLAEMVQAKVISNSKYLSHDIQAVMRRCTLFMGMRFHSLVLSSAVGVPVIGLVYMPKVLGYLRYLKCEDFALQLGPLTAARVAERLKAAWQSADSLKARQQAVVEQLKSGAARAAITVKEFLEEK